MESKQALIELSNKRLLSKVKEAHSELDGYMELNDIKVTNISTRVDSNSSRHLTR
jgi:hypothetical protein